MPYFNHGVFVDEALASVRGQTRPVDRVVVVDDGSTDAHSLDVLGRLETEADVEVIRQANRGPGAARNRGIVASTADALVLLDADDRLEPDHIAAALSALEGAPPSVGFAYPDQQSFGTLDDLTVMPAYNLFTLTDRNYCGTGCIVDRGVFDAGHAFAEDLRHGHEDWEFFLRIGAAGIEGVDFHGPALEWRRWGYSRSDGINERTMSYTDELRALHPEVFEPARLIGLKQRWSPALSVVVAQPPSTVAAQTCGDYEVVDAGTGAPAVRGRWVAVLGTAAAGLLDEETFVERVLRCVADDWDPRDDTAVLLSSSPDANGAVRWQILDAPGFGPPDGVVVEGSRYDRWRLGADPAETADDEGAAPLLAGLAAEVAASAHWRWTGPAPGERRRGIGVEPVAEPLPPPAPCEVPDAAGLDPARRALAGLRGAAALEKERLLRWRTPPLLFPRSGPRHRPRADSHAAGATGRGRWAPSPTVALELVVADSGQAVLEAVREGDPALDATRGTGEARVTLGRLWTRAFPGNLALYVRIDVRSHSPAYRVSAGPAAELEMRMGFAATEAMSGTVALSASLDRGVAILASRGISVRRPDVVLEGPEVYLEPADLPAVVELRRRGRLAPYLSGAGGMGATLYELELPGGRVRYSTHPDDAVAHPELGRGAGVAVAELGPVTGPSAAPVLQEVDLAPPGGIGYVTGPVGPGEGVPGPVLGAFCRDIRAGVPLIRLGRGANIPGSPNDPGHRLAVDWRPLAELGYEMEGAVGFVWDVDPLEAPLYWWHRAGSAGRLLTMGGRPDGGGWEFGGTLGLAWRTRAAGPGLVGLWELSAGDQLVYAVDPSEFLAVGFTCERVVAKVSRVPRTGSVPLWRTAVGDDSPWRFTTCPADGEADGYVRQGIVCHLLAAHPPPAAPPDPGDARRQAPDGGVPDGTVAGPVPGGLPVYLVSRRGQRWATTWLPADLDQVAVEEVLGFLPPSSAAAGS
jgi:hypothetical protein